MKKINWKEIFNFNKNEDMIVKRNWKKIGIWTAVGSTLIAGLVPAIYFPIVLNMDSSDPAPHLLNAISKDKGIDLVREGNEPENQNKYWGIYLDIEDNTDSDFVLYKETVNEDTNESEFDKNKLEGPFSQYLEYDSSFDNWYTFWNINSEDATDFIAEWFWNAYRLEGYEYGPVQEEYFHVSALNPTIDWNSFNQDTQKTFSVTKEDKSETSEEDTYSLEFGDGLTSITSPMWFTFKGNDLLFVVDGVSRTEGQVVDLQSFVKLQDASYDKGGDK